MRISRLFAVMLTLSLAGAARSDDTVVCKDGTTSKGGSGACSGHGGIDKNAKSTPAAAPAAVPTPTPQKAASLVARDDVRNL